MIDQSVGVHREQRAGVGVAGGDLRVPSTDEGLADHVDPFHHLGAGGAHAQPDLRRGYVATRPGMPHEGDRVGRRRGMGHGLHPAKSVLGARPRVDRRGTPPARPGPAIARPRPTSLRCAPSPEPPALRFGRAIDADAAQPARVIGAHRAIVRHHGAHGPSPPFEVLRPEQLRRRTSVKWQYYGPDVLPLWVAEMDVLPAPEVVEALTAAVRAGDTGYPNFGTTYKEALSEFAGSRWGWEPDPADMLLCADVMTGIRVLIDRFCPGAGHGRDPEPGVPAVRQRQPGGRPAGGAGRAHGRGPARRGRDRRGARRARVRLRPTITLSCSCAARTTRPGSCTRRTSCRLSPRPRSVTAPWSSWMRSTHRWCPRAPASFPGSQSLTTASWSRPLRRPSTSPGSRRA